MKIKIHSRFKFNEDLEKMARAIDHKNLNKLYKKNSIYFESMAAVRKILTDNRLEVWRAIKDKKPDSITHLAEILNRAFRPVHRDVMLLEELGLIKLTEGPTEEGSREQLKSLYDQLILSVA
jgi:predicted transcriptional regulator